MRELLQSYNGEKTWDQFPDHVVLFYAKSYLANTKNKKFPWYQKLSDLVLDEILLNENSDV
jgi:hypothetical protein